MKFCNVILAGEPAPVAAVRHGEDVVPLFQLIPEVNGVSHEISGKPMPMGAFTGQENNLTHLSSWVSAIESVDADLLEISEHWHVDSVRFAPPVWQPNSFRDFYAFENHVKTSRGRRGLEMIPQWYELPVFYFSNHRCFSTDGDSLPFPSGGEWLDFELEVAAVVTRPGANLSLEAAEEAIGGYCILNDWSLRDVQREEMAVGLGPAKGKDFASGLGSWLVTPDEIADKRAGKGFDLKMSARINGELVSRGNWSSIFYSFAEMLQRASENVTLYPGDIIGSGTVGSGCILELGPDTIGGWLKPGDVVELEIESLGSIKNTISAR